MSRTDSLKNNVDDAKVSDPQEFYLLEKLYEVMSKDRKRKKRPSMREFYLMEKLYDVMMKDKSRHLESF